MAIRLIISLGVIIAILYTTACVDASFLTNCRTIEREYCLYYFDESGNYYLERKGGDFSGGGVVDGTIARIGWDENYIIAFRYSMFGRIYDGWMVIDLRSDKIVGPFKNLNDIGYVAAKNISPAPVDRAWQKLNSYY